MNLFLINRALIYLLLSFLFLLILTPQWPKFGDDSYQIEAIVGQRQFDFLLWELDAFAVKANGIIGGTHRYLSDEEQSQLVLTYLELLQASQQLSAQIDQIYVDPAIADPDTATAALQAEFAEARLRLDKWQPVAEAIVQDQVGAILVEEGFALAGRVWPPVIMHMSPLPTMLIVSPRDKIERLESIPLQTGVTTPEMEGMETAVYQNLDLSALVVPVGGLGTFPAMIQETSSINWLVEVTAHEWSHHWMSFYPVGWNYTIDPDIRIINETVASTIDVEIAARVIARYYPDFVPPPPPETPPTLPEAEPEEIDPSTPLPFDFLAEMGETRTVTDRLLAEGQIEAAEAYMEARRRYFVENGYRIRKLNQAYFAFYGAYAAVPGGASGNEDPIGPAVRQVRAQSPSLYAFMTQVASVNSLAELQALGESGKLP